jgi:putative SOS response-associated peptidase YedK
MCGRFTLKNKKAVKKHYGIDVIPNYNIAPSQKILVFNGEKIFYANWAFSPKWAKIPMNLINARNESLHLKPSFKNSNRCIIIADGWYEWQRLKDKKIPYYHYSSSDIIFMAGIYNEEGCAIVTTNANKNITHIHHRQPLLINSKSIMNWFKAENIFNNNISYEIKYYVVSKYVNSPLNNDEKCIESI